MDFFSHQEQAKRRTGTLVVLFLLAVVSIVIAVYGVIAGAFAIAGPKDENTATVQAEDLLGKLWNPELFAVVSAGTLTLIGGGTAYKVAALSGGGQTVAEMLGGKPIHPETRDREERRVLNVVEEMAIAAGTPVPPVYLMEGEEGINAFAAGYAPEDAVIGVTRGTVRHLSRDELQGVIAHEFSHILNGDMKLNLRLIGLLHGILLISITGWILFRSTQHARVSTASSSGRDDSNRGQNIIPLVGLALYILGYIGVFFARLIKAAVSRQREYLADASAVQFTRNPDGLAGALKKIGALSEGSRVRDPEAEEASHLFFGEAVWSAFSLLATHPPLIQRIKRIDPSFDGDFSRIDLRPSTDREESEAASLPRSRASNPATRLDPARAITRIGTLDPASIAFAAAILDELDPGLRAQVHDPLAAQGIVYALLLEGDDQALRAAQVQNLRDRLPEPILSATMDAVPRVDHLLPERRLALADITAMSLHGLSLSQRQDLLENVQRLILADQKATPFEVALQRNLVRFLSSRKASPGSPAGGTKPAPVPSAPAGADVAGETRRLLSALAFAGNDERADAARAFSVGANRLGWLSGTDQMLEESVPTPESVRDALRRLALASPATQRSVLEACAATIAADDHITPRENELFRVVSSALGAPPPLSTL